MRPPGWDTSERGDNGLPHVVRPPQQANAMRYQVAGGKIFSGLTRVVWELEEVKSGQGATSFLSGSHKAHFNYGGPDRYRPNIDGSPWEESMRDMMDDYSCPPGSVVIFSESLVHAANSWTNPDNPRCAVFNCYNSIWAQWHRLNLSDEATRPCRRAAAASFAESGRLRTLWRQCRIRGRQSLYQRSRSPVCHCEMSMPTSIRLQLANRAAAGVRLAGNSRPARQRPFRG